MRVILFSEPDHSPEQWFSFVEQLPEQRNYADSKGD